MQAVYILFDINQLVKTKHTSYHTRSHLTQWFLFECKQIRHLLGSEQVLHTMTLPSSRRTWNKQAVSTLHNIQQLVLIIIFETHHTNGKHVQTFLIAANTTFFALRSGHSVRQNIKENLKRVIMQSLIVWLTFQLQNQYFVYILSEQVRLQQTWRKLSQGRHVFIEFELYVLGDNIKFPSKYLTARTPCFIHKVNLE